MNKITRNAWFAILHCIQANLLYKRKKEALRTSF
ncbi:MAG: hypothetical protein RL213_1402 [Bacteroidota bacterium]